MQSPHPGLAAGHVHVLDPEGADREFVRELARSSGYSTTDYGEPAEFLGRRPVLDIPECLVSELWMPGLTGLGLLETLVGSDAELPFIFHTQRAEVDIAVRAMREGASDFLLKPASTHVLIEAIHGALRRDLELKARRRRERENSSRLATLSRREHEVFLLVADGFSSQKIAEQLGISKKTVEQHRSKIGKKVKADSIAELVRLRLEMASRL